MKYLTADRGRNPGPPHLRRRAVWMHIYGTQIARAATKVTMPYDKELNSALEAARAAGKIQIGSRGRIGAVQRKSDDSPVTAVDRKCEAIIRDALLKRFPADGFLGEETGCEAGTSGRTWIVDPLDGTRPYTRGIPTYSSLIALEDGDELAVGCMHLPALGETYWAKKGGGAFCNGIPIRVSREKRLSRVIGSGLGFVEKAAARDGKRLLSLMKTWDYAYGFMDAYSYGGVAYGRLDVCVNLLDKPWDCAAAACIVSEAGGAYSDVKGNRSVRNGSVILSNGFVHDAVVEYFL
jgi:histidinol-phosphatase